MPCKCPSWARICPLSGAISQQRQEGGVQHPKNGTFTDPGFSIASLGLNFFRSFEHRSPHETYHVDPRGPTWLTWPSCWVTLVTPGLRFATSQQQLRPVSDGSVGPFSSHFEVILSITSTLRGYVGILWCPLWLGWCLNGTFRYSWSETDQTHTDTRAYVYIYIYRIR